MFHLLMYSIYVDSQHIICSWTEHKNVGLELNARKNAYVYVHIF
jgi:hypothetical protein